MSVVTIVRADQLGGPATVFDSGGHPPPEILPVVWLDLHVSEDHYYTLSEPGVQRCFNRDSKSGVPYLTIPAKQGVRFLSRERVGVDAEHVAMVTNVASRAIQGLIVAPGKVDPGYTPNPLALVAFNQSSRSVCIHAGDKIASLAFLKLSEPCRSPPKEGYADRLPTGIEPGRVRSIVDAVKVALSHPLVIALVGGAIGAMLTKLLGK